MRPLFDGIKSRPIYTGLEIDRAARRHLFVCETAAVAKLQILLNQETALLHDSTELLLTGTDSTALTSADNKAKAENFNRLRRDMCHVAPSLPSLLTRLGVILGTASMGLRLYIMGSEDFIGQVAATAQLHGIDFDSLVTEQIGSLARRVQCVHCKGMIDHVTTNIVPCPHCGLTLFVRDHYSRRFGAFQGVCVNAEDATDIPPRVEIYP